MLTDEGYQVRHATTGTAALAAMLTAPPDLLLIDLLFGTMSGLEVIQAARAWSFAMPMVIMTAATVEAHVLEAQGASATLHKPFALDDLLACVARHMPPSRKECSMTPAILMVDDEPAVLALLRRVMHDLAGDYDVIAIPDGATALALIALRSVAFVVTDYQMPDMDGVALTAAIKAAAPQCPVILMTGHSTPEIEHNAGVAGADFFLSKPFPLAQLDAAVRAALAH